MYRYPSAYTRPVPEIAVFAGKAEKLCRKLGKKQNLEKAVCVMGMLYEGFSYEPGSTDISTTAGEALKQGKGVCQDYAHIMTAVLRYMGIPARYVAGLMIGEGYTHAWVEVYTQDGWYGLDPTNNLHIDDMTYVQNFSREEEGDDLVQEEVYRELYLLAKGLPDKCRRVFELSVEEIKNDGNSGGNETAGG